jgi:glycosyltransferase involved in cell wall biosynthesis
MRIALVAQRPGEATPTGTGRYLRALAQALVREAGPEHELLLVCAPERAPAASWENAGLERRQLPWPRRPLQLGWCLGGGPRLERALGALDAVHLAEPFPPAPSAAPQLVTVHDLFPLEHPRWYPLSQRVIYRASLLLARRRARRFVVPSRYVAERLRASLGVQPGRIEVVHHGVAGAFACRPPERELQALCARFGVEPGRYLVAVGAVSDRKNLVTLARASARLAGRHTGLLLIGSDGVGAERVDAEIARLDGGARAIRTGYLPDAQVAGLVQAAGALAHPALSEGFGLVPLEAMAAGTPVIASRAGAIPEVVGDAAVLVDEPRDPAAWAQALASVIDDPARREQLAAAGRERARDFSWAAAARRMLEIYADVACG